MCLYVTKFGFTLAYSVFVKIVQFPLHTGVIQVRDNSEYESMIQAVIATRSFYYSHSYDITLSLQKVEQFGERRTNFAHLPLHERVSYYM